jgi:hypothetical protein
MAPQATPPPPAKNMSQMQYFMQLTQMGYTVPAAYAATSQYFGPQSQANNQSNAALGQTAGQIAGLAGAYWARNGFQLPSLFGGGASGAGTEATAAALGQGAPSGMTAVGTAADGSIMYAPTSSLGASGAGETALAGESSTLGSIGSAALPIAAAVAAASTLWEDGMKDVIRGKGDRADWTNLGIDALTGTLPNMALRLMGKRSIGAMMKSGKSKDQSLRDDFRDKLKETGVADKNYHVTLANGDKFDIGLDGKTQYTNIDKNIDGKTTRNAWDVDFSNPLAKYAVGQIDPSVRKIYDAEAEKAGIKPEQYTGILVNAATSNAKSEADVLANIHAMLGKSTFAQQGGVGSNVTPNEGPPINAKGGKAKDNLDMYYFK